MSKTTLEEICPVCGEEEMMITMEIRSGERYGECLNCGSYEENSKVYPNKKIIQIKDSNDNDTLAFLKVNAKEVDLVKKLVEEYKEKAKNDINPYTIGTLLNYIKQEVNFESILSDVEELYF